MKLVTVPRRAVQCRRNHQTTGSLSSVSRKKVSILFRRGGGSGGDDRFAQARGLRKPTCAREGVREARSEALAGICSRGFTGGGVLLACFGFLSRQIAAEQDYT